MMNKPLWLCTAILSLALTACGGDSSDSGGGNNSSATINSDNKSAMAQASSVGAKRAVDSQAAPGARNSSGTTDSILTILNDTFSSFHVNNRTAQSRAQIEVPGLCTTGSATYDASGFSQSGTGTVTVTYNDCTYSYGTGSSVTVDGTADWTINDDQSFSYSYDMTVSYNGVETVLSGTFSCDSEFNCSYEDSFVSGGVGYEVSNVSVSGNPSSGFDVTARVSHEDYGYIDIVGEDLIACDGGGFSSGTITVSDSSGSNVLTVSFSNCNEMTVTFEGVSETLAQ